MTDTETKPVTDAEAAELVRKHHPLFKLQRKMEELRAENGRLREQLSEAVRVLEPFAQQAEYFLPGGSPRRAAIKLSWIRATRDFVRRVKG